jgi:hypothetical protein
MSNERKPSTSRPTKAPQKPTAKDSSEKWVSEEEVDAILESDAPEYSTEERETLDRYLLQKGFIDTTDEMIGKASIYIR